MSACARSTGKALLAVTSLCLAACAALDDPPPDDMLVDDAAESCVRRNPRVDAEVARAVEENAVVTDCLSDSGECQASIPCQGSIDERECDAALFFGPDASSCIALARGQQRGLRELEPQLGYDFGHRRVTWSVRNVQHESPDGTSGGQIFVIDAITGELLDQLGWIAQP